MSVVGPVAAILIFLLIPVGAALFLLGYFLVVLALKVPLSVWALTLAVFVAAMVSWRRLRPRTQAGGPPLGEGGPPVG